MIGIPQVESILEVQPHLRACVRKFSQAQRHIGAYTAFAPDKLVYCPAMDFELVCQLLLSQTKLFQNVGFDKFARVYGLFLGSIVVSPWKLDSVSDSRRFVPG